MGLALRQRCSLLFIVLPPAVCGEGDSLAHPARSVLWLCLSPCPQGSRGCLTIPEVAEDAWEVMGWWGCPCAWWGCCWEALLWDPAVTTNYGVRCSLGSLVATLNPPKVFFFFFVAEQKLSSQQRKLMVTQGPGVTFCSGYCCGRGLSCVLG